MTSNPLSAGDLAVDRELADLAGGFRFLLDLTPVDLPEVRRQFEQDGRVPELRYRELEDDPEVALKRLAQVPVHEVSDPMLANLLMAKQRELRLQLEMLGHRGSEQLLALSIELYGAVTSELLATAQQILAEVSPRARRRARGSMPRRCAGPPRPSSTATGRSPPTSSPMSRSARAAPV